MSGTLKNMKTDKFRPMSRRTNLAYLTVCGSLSVPLWDKAVTSHQGGWDEVTAHILIDNFDKWRTLTMTLLINTANYGISFFLTCNPTMQVFFFFFVLTDLSLGVLLVVFGGFSLWSSSLPTLQTWLLSWLLREWFLPLKVLRTLLNRQRLHMGL